jgi:hypothetical protein
MERMQHPRAFVDADTVGLVMRGFITPGIEPEDLY